MACIPVLKEVLTNKLATEFKDSAVDCGVESFSEKEQALQKMLQEIGQIALSGWLE